MKHIHLMIFPLILTSLACLETTIPAQTAAQTATLPPTMEDTEPHAGAVYEIPMATPAQVCARVTADSALHLRTDAHADAQIIAYLTNGQIVKVLERGADWWKVSNGFLIGYARSTYLTETECE